MRLARPLRNWGQLALQVALLLVGLGLLQAVAARTNRRIDLTPTGSLSLSPLTTKVLAEVTAPLRLTVFYRRGERERQARLLERLRTANRHVEFELLDLDRHPERARALGVSQYGRAAVEYQGRRVVANAEREEELAGGILRALRGRARRIIFTTGHGERTPGGQAESYGRLATALEAENYAPEGLSLLGGDAPDDADVVVLAGPTSDFLPPELAALAQHLARGGGMLMLLDPAPLPNLTRFLAGLGIGLRDDFVVDREQRVLGTEGLAAVVEFFKRGNPISEASRAPLQSGAVLPSARTVDVRAEMPGVHAESIARTGATAWAMADPSRARRGEEPSRARDDVPGPVSLMVLAETGPGGAERRPGRLVVVGDADFASDAYLDLLGNRDLVLNALAWVAGEEALAGERTKRIPEVVRPLSPLVLTAPQARAIFVAAVIVEPALVLLAGGVFVGLRRRRG